MLDNRTQIVIGYSTNLFSEGLESIIDELDNYTFIESAPLGDRLIKVLERLNFSDVLLVEMKCPRTNDLNYLRSLCERFPSVRALLISGNPHNSMISRLLESGIEGYLLNSCTRNDLISALDKMRDGGSYFCPAITKNLLSANREAQHEKDITLTMRETEVLGMLVNCQTNIEIASDLGLSENTVKTHRKNIQTKFGVNNLLGMVRYACRASLIDYGNDEFCQDCPHCASSHL